MITEDDYIAVLRRYFESRVQCGGSRSYALDDRSFSDRIVVAESDEDGRVSLLSFDRKRVVEDLRLAIEYVEEYPAQLTGMDEVALLMEVGLTDRPCARVLLGSEVQCPAGTPTDADRP